MENKLSCSVVRDLLPLYAEELVSEETKTAVDDHLGTCPDCRDALRDIRPEQPTPEANRKDVDFLKKVRSKSRKRTVITTILGIFITLLGISLLYYTGTAANSAEIDCRTYVDGKNVTVEMKAASDTQRITRVCFTSSNGMVNVIAYTSPRLFFRNEAKEYSHTIDFQITQVHMGNTVLWERGMEISEKASALYKTQHPYIGDMSQNVQTAVVLGVREQFGTFTNELQTESAPYGWTLILEETIPAAREELSIELMRAYSCVFLALIDNLDTVVWSYPTEHGTEMLTFTTEDASKLLGMDIKKVITCTSDTQKLLDTLGIS